MLFVKAPIVYAFKTCMFLYLFFRITTRHPDFSINAQVSSPWEAFVILYSAPVWRISHTVSANISHPISANISHPLSAMGLLLPFKIKCHFYASACLLNLTICIYVCCIYPTYLCLSYTLYLTKHNILLAISGSFVHSETSLESSKLRLLE